MSQSNRSKETKRTRRSAKKTILWILFGVVVFVVIAFFAISAIAAAQLTLPKRRFDPALNPSTVGLEYEDVRFPARTGDAEIAAWYIPSEEISRAVIFVPGRDDSRSFAFAGHFNEFAKAFHEKGISVLMIDLRGHGESSAARYTFGIKERRDVLGAVDWLESQGYKPGSIGVYGYSLGAASVIGAAAEETDIASVAVDSAYTDILPVVKVNWQRESGLPLIFLYSTRWMIQLMYGYDIMDSHPIQEITKIPPRPIMMIHCDTDAMIPVSHLEAFREVVPDAEIWIIHGCEHALAYRELENRPEYDRRLTGFFEESLK